MSSALSERERSWIAGLQSILLKFQAYPGWWRRRVGQDQSQLVAEVANDLFAMMEIWVVDAGLQTNFSPLKRVVKGHCSCRPLRESIHTKPEKVKGKCTKAHIACRHRLVETYRGYLLFSDTARHTFLIDMRTHAYVKGSATHLLQIDGIDQAKRFVDELCSRLQVDQGAPFN